ncbi:Cysteine-rich membrane protein 2 [Spironucleus salmonicida]|uniref:Cysteine-rich membrane protein 2 n=2 Tax=Spironucleus salmonicida TaxID=348837 RepID=A0A9P8LWC5_9EUKA|nr:Cysteine-rich membrane protein 2 [Spironucleus salmonicida]KAH0575812.1 Cysteine-rich membrane protein 2 [Spironucleus salmonicida]
MTGCHVVGCIECPNNPYVCQACTTDFKLVDNYCLSPCSACPEGTSCQGSSSTCTACSNPNCLNCEGMWCLQCKTGYKLQGHINCNKMTCNDCSYGFFCDEKALVSCIDCTKIPEGKFCNCYHSRIQNCLSCNQITGNCSNCLQGYFPAKNGQKCIRNGTCLVTQDCGLNQFCQGSKCVKGDLAHPVSCGELLNCTSCVSPFFCLRCSGDYHLGEDLKCLTPRCETLELNQYCKDVNVPAACPGPFACRCPNQRDHCATCDSDGCATCLAGFALSKHGCTRNVCTSSADCLFGSFCAEKGCQGCESIGSGGYCNCGALVQNCALCSDGVCLKCQHGSQLTQGYCVITDSSDGAVDVKLMIEISVAIIIVVIGVTLIILFVIFKKYSPKQNGFEKIGTQDKITPRLMDNSQNKSLEFSLSHNDEGSSTLVQQ